MEFSKVNNKALVDAICASRTQASPDLLLNLKTHNVSNTHLISKSIMRSTIYSIVAIVCGLSNSALAKDNYSPAYSNCMDKAGGATYDMSPNVPVPNSHYKMQMTFATKTQWAFYQTRARTDYGSLMGCRFGLNSGMLTVVSTIIFRAAIWTLLDGAGCEY
ncbi:hypothetical protein ACXX9E_29265 [Pseudomonas sp. GNP014]